jgi:hypothetical protein
MDALLPFHDQPDTPDRPELGITHLGGRGLMIIDGLARDWGAYRKADGKVVWVMVSPPDGP